MTNFIKILLSLGLGVNLQLIIITWAKRDVGVYEAFAMIIAMSVFSGVLFGTLSFLTAYRGYKNEDAAACLVRTPVTYVAAIVTMIQMFHGVNFIYGSLEKNFMTNLLILAATFIASLSVGGLTYCATQDALFSSSGLRFKIKERVEEEIINLFIPPTAVAAIGGPIIALLSLVVSDPTHYVLAAFFVLICVPYVLAAPYAVRHSQFDRNYAFEDKSFVFGKHEAMALGVVVFVMLCVVFIVDPDNRLSAITRSGVILFGMLAKIAYDYNYDRATQKLKKKFGGLVIENKN